MIDIITVVLFVSFLLFILPSQSEEWTTQWWKWIMYTDANLILDPTGANIMQYQPNTGDDDDVYLLTGAYGSNMTRNVTIPEGKIILIPVLNGFATCIDCSLVQRIISNVENESGVDNPVLLEAELDGKEIPYHRITSISDLTITDKNPFPYLKNYIGKTLMITMDGYWTAIDTDELDGDNHRHVIYTHGMAENGYSTEVRYNIEIK